MMISTTQANKKTQKVPTAVLKIAAALFWIFIWFIASRAVGSELLLPSPAVTLARLWELALKGSFWLAVLQSLLRIIAGCALGIAAGSILGVLTAMSRVLYELFTPLLTVVRSTPVASFIILALVWIKRDNVAVFIAFLMVLPIRTILNSPELHNSYAFLRPIFNMVRISSTEYVRFPTEYFGTICSNLN